MQTWMMTIPMESECEVGTWMWLSWNPVTVVRRCTKKLLSYIFEQSDTKRYIVGIEKGRNGLDHFQIRLSCSDNLFFEHMKEWCEWAHVEKAESDSFEYERKEGRYWTSMDTKEIRIQRFGKPNRTQQRVIDVLRRTNDREIVLWYSDKGSIGKSWLVGHLWETGEAYVCQPQDTVKGMKQDVASEYIKHGWRPIIVVDLPRTWKWTKDLYCALESIKDGLLKDTRYSSDTINIKGVKVLVTSNTLPKFDALSLDRWIVIENTL